MSLELKAEILKPEPCKVNIMVEIAKENVIERSENVFAQIQRSAVLPGFRQGKVPAALVKKNFADIARDEILQKMIPEAIEQITKENNLISVSQAEIAELDFDFARELKFKVFFEVKPEIVLQDYKGLPIEKEKLEITDKEVAAALENLRQRAAQLVVATHDTAKENDYLVIDYELFNEGQAVPNGKSENVVMLAQDSQALPGFIAQLIGIKKGEQKDITITLPADFQRKELASKEVVFKVVLKEIKQKKLPELNDDFAKELGENLTLEQLKEKLKNNLEKQKEASIKKDLEGQIVKILLEKHDFPLPDSLVEKQIEFLIARTKQFVAQQGRTVEEMGLTDEIMRAKVKNDAQNQVKTFLLLEEIGRRENLTVTDEDINQEIEKTIVESTQPAEAVREYFTKYHNQIVSQLEDEKVFKFLLDNAQIKEVKARKKKEPEFNTEELSEGVAK